MKLYLTHCGADKNYGILAPQEMYKSPRIQRFVKWCEGHSCLWAILSAKYGLFFPDERKLNYNVTLNRRRQNSGCFLNVRVEKNSIPLDREESKSHVSTLARSIRDQIRTKEIGQIIFHIEGLCPDAYVAVLHYAADGCDSLPNGHANLEPHLWTCIKAGRMKLARDLDIG
jgi:hypothetical protein